MPACAAGVRVSPGATQLTVIPSGPSERASERANPISAALLVDVREQVGRRGAPDGVRNDQHDPPKTALRHPGRKRLAQPQRRLDVDRHDAAPGGEVDVVQRGPVKRRGGVHERVAAPEACQYAGGGSPNLVGIAELDRELPGAIEDRHLLPITAKGAGNRAPDRAITARDRCHP